MSGWKNWLSFLFVTAVSVTLWGLMFRLRVEDELVRLRVANQLLQAEVDKQKTEVIRWKTEYGAIKAVHWDCTRK